MSLIEKTDIFFKNHSLGRDQWSQMFYTTSRRRRTTSGRYEGDNNQTPPNNNLFTKAIKGTIKITWRISDKNFCDALIKGITYFKKDFFNFCEESLTDVPIIDKCSTDENKIYEYIFALATQIKSESCRCIDNNSCINIDFYSFEDIIAQVTEKSDNRYITGYTSTSIKKLFATNIHGNIRKMNRQQFIDSGIDPIPYEILLAQIISREYNDKKYFNFLQILNDVADSWSIFINSENQVVGFWVFVALKDDAFSKYSSGQHDEKDINLNDIHFMSTQGIYKGYLLLSGIVSELRSPKISNEIYNSWIKWIEELADIGIFFSDICSIVSSTAGMSSLEEIGMVPYADYKLGGKCFNYNLYNISNIKFLCKNYPNLVEKYKILANY